MQQSHRRVGPRDSSCPAPFSHIHKLTLASLKQALNPESSYFRLGRCRPALPLAVARSRKHATPWSTHPPSTPRPARRTSYDRPARGVAYAFSHSFIYTLVNTSHRHRAHKYATSGLKCQKAKEMWNAVRKERRKCDGGCRGWGRASSRLSSAEGREEGVGRCIVKNKTAAVRAM